MVPKLSCPNCNSPLTAEPAHCDVCGYRTEQAAEFLWLYLGGAVITLLGFGFGVIAVLSEGAGLDHWSRELRGWYPLGPIAGESNWLAFLITGIALTVGGLGITRRKLSAWWLLVILTLYQLIWPLLQTTQSSATSLLAMVLTVGHLAIGALLLRAGAALRRLPARSAEVMQHQARRLQGGAEATGRNSNAQETPAQAPPDN